MPSLSLRPTTARCTSSATVSSADGRRCCPPTLPGKISYHRWTPENSVHLQPKEAFNFSEIRTGKTFCRIDFNMSFEAGMEGRLTWPAILSPYSGATLVVDRVADRQRALHPHEEPYAADMVGERLQQYRAGRSVARQALQLVGGPVTGIAAGAAGEPLWPSGFSGSISHAGGYAAALVAPQSRFTSVGLDLNDGLPLGDAATADLMTDDEVTLVLNGGLAADLESARNIVFSAKEALYKCQYPLLGLEDLDFDAVTLVKGKGPTLLGAHGVNLPIGVESKIRFVEIVPIVVHGLTLVGALLPAANQLDV